MRNDSSVIRCKQSEAVLEDYLTGELPRPAAEQLMAHLNGCSACREALEEARLSSRLINKVFEPAEEPGPAFTHLVMAKINAAEAWMREQRIFWRPFEAIAWRLAFSAALALMLMFAYGMQFSNAVTTVAAPTPTAFAQPTDSFTPPSAVPSSDDEVLLAIAERRHER
ncbi:MAG TPA: zf-HC2 domain-containing protein [Candidatus Acidoferrales bacterium]|nr:zf-HC2 domain-containing protein [Candidatus Acidoferrales bacterium]